MKSVNLLKMHVCLLIIIFTLIKSVSLLEFRIVNTTFNGEIYRILYKNLLSKLLNTTIKNGRPPRNGLFIVVFLGI